MASKIPQEISKTKSSSSIPVFPQFLRLFFLLAGDAAAGWFIYKLISLGYYPFAAAIFVLALFINFVLFYRRAYPLRWMIMGLVLMGLFTIYPIIFTVWVSFTNYGEGHLVTKEQAIVQILKMKYMPESGKSYSWTAYKSDAGEYALWLIDTEGNGWLALPGVPLSQPVAGEAGISAFDDKGIPVSIEGYKRVSGIVAASDKNLPGILFGDPTKTIQVRSPKEAAELLPQYMYDPDLDAMISQETGVIYQNIRGTFSSPTGEPLRPGFTDTIGISNFREFFTSPALRGPILRIILWNFAFAFLSLLLNFSLGLVIAILYNEKDFPLKKIIRSLLIIPYTVPALITILIWRGMLNSEMGVVNDILRSLFNWAPAWFTNEWWAKIAILIVNLWLSYPYFMLICSGALQSISEDYYDAAEVDGANPWQRFTKITLPLLLVAVGPLLVASFTFNFNNFNLIYLFNAGGPPMAGTPTPAGHTDILISYVYNLAFTASRGIDYGFASAITMIIFIIVGTITLFQFRFTKMWEEVSENV